MVETRQVPTNLDAQLAMSVDVDHSKRGFEAQKGRLYFPQSTMHLTPSFQTSPTALLPFNHIGTRT